MRLQRYQKVFYKGIYHDFGHCHGGLKNTWTGQSQTGFIKVIICYINFGGTRHENIYGKHSKC